MCGSVKKGRGKVEAEHTLLAVWKDGHCEYTDRLEHNGRILVPFPRKGEILKRVRLPREAKSYESVQSLHGEIQALLERCLVLEKLSRAATKAQGRIDKLPLASYAALKEQPTTGILQQGDSAKTGAGNRELGR
jgi:hypothetical protein